MVLLTTLLCLMMSLPALSQTVLAQEGININTASVDQLTSLPGIGSAKAEAIVTHRKEHGAFTRVTDLLEVKGIGPNLLEKLEGLITVTE
jgi:competence protein ComEA